MSPSPSLARRSSQLAWLVPFSALAAIGLFGKVAGRPPAATELWLLAGCLLLGAALGAVTLAGGGDRSIRARGLLGLGAAAVTLALLGTFAALGARARDVSARRAAQLKAAAAAAVTDYPGWYGAAQLGPVRIFAVEMNAASEFARTVSALYPSPLTLVAVGVDNRAGPTDITLDLAGLYVQDADGRVEPAPDRDVVLSEARGDPDAVALHAGPYRVPAGASVNHALAFLPAGKSMERTTALLVKLNGAPAVIRGHWLTLSEKQSMRRPPDR